MVEVEVVSVRERVTSCAGTVAPPVETGAKDSVAGEVIGDMASTIGAVCR